MGNRILLNNLTYKCNETTFFDNLDCYFESGRIYGVYLNSELEKNTFNDLLLGNLELNQGEIQYNQQEINYSNWYYFTKNHSLQLDLTLKECLEEFILKANLDPKIARKEFEFYQKKLKINLKITKKIKEFSQDQQQLIYGLMMLITSPDVVIFDEPVNNLKLKTQQAILQMIQMMKVDKDRIVIVTTNKIDQIKDIITNIVILYQGKILYNNKYYKNKDAGKLVIKNIAQLQRTLAN